MQTNEETNGVQRKMYIETPITVRTYDVDYMQIVNNTVYIKWFEDMRMAILDKYFPLKEMLEAHNSPILAETHVKYIHSIGLDTKPIGKAWLSEIDRSRWVANFIIEDETKVYCTGSQVGYYFNLDSRRPVRFPKSFLDYYASL